MARGRPLLWGAILGLLTGGAGVYATQTTESAPPELGYPLILLGIVTIVIGAYVRQVAPGGPDVETVDTFQPSQLSSYIIISVSAVFLLGTIYLLYSTEIPYVYPTITFVTFLITFIKGSVRYWQNSLTTYYVTDDRIISEYRFLSLKRSSINHSDVTNVARRQSVVETLTGLGSLKITVAGSRLRMRDIGNPQKAEQLLNSLSS
jgi:hypothetical protein